MASVKGSNATLPVTTALTDAAGEFAIASVSSDTSLVVADPGVVTVAPAFVTAEPAEQKVTIIVAPLIEIAGRVIDEAGRGIRGAEVALRIPGEAFAACASHLDGRACVYLDTAKSDDAGEFEFDRAAVATRAELSVSAPDYEPVRVEAPHHSDRDVVVRLERQPTVRGRVVHPDGSPAIHSIVYGPESSVPVDARGEFALRSRAALKRIRVAAIEPGANPAMLSVELPAAEVTLVVGGPARSITGRVETATGRGLAKWKVELDVKRGVFDRHYSSLEELAGASSSTQATDENGEFVIAGLIDESYRLRARSDDLSAVVETEPIPAGTTNVRIVVPEHTTIAHLTGRVVTASGNPVPGARVVLSYPDSADRVRSTSPGHTALADAEGVFTLRRMPSQHPWIDVRGDSIMPARRIKLDLDAPQPIDVVVAERATFRIDESAVPAGMTAIGVNDSSGKPLDIYEFHGSKGYSGPLTRPQVYGASGWMHVAVDGAELVFYREDAIIGRREIRLSAAEHTVVR